MSFPVPLTYQAWVRETIEATRAMANGDDVPVAALVADETGRVIARGQNEREQRKDPTAHAEILALRRAAGVRGTWNLTGCTLVVSLEPCPMCAGALASARISSVVFGAWDDKAGAAGSVCDLLRDRRFPHRAEVYGGVLEEECLEVLTEFFRRHRVDPQG